MNKQTVMLYCACQFTRIGLEQIINDYISSAPVDMIHCPQNGYLPGKPQMSAIDTLILVPCQDISQTISFLSSLSRQLPSTLKVVLITEQGSPDWITRYLHNQVSRLTVLKASMPLATLAQRLTETLRMTQVRHHLPETLPLSMREQRVLKGLLNGKNANQLARELEISYKTVSAHKRNALLKLGVNSLHGLLACKVRP